MSGSGGMSSSFMSQQGMMPSQSSSSNVGLGIAGGRAPGGMNAESSNKSQKTQDTDSPATAKKGRTNTPWTAAEELRLKQMRDASHSWSEIAKTFPQRTEGSVKKHWYKVSTRNTSEGDRAK